MMVGAHVVCSLLSYAAFLLACISGALFLVQERQLKHKHMGLLFHRLPALDTLDRMNFLAVGIGFGLLSLGVACGLLGTRLLRGQWWLGDSKEYVTLIVWLSYCALWLIRLRSTLRGRRMALLSVMGFSLVLFTFLGASYLLPSGHPYL